MIRFINVFSSNASIFPAQMVKPFTDQCILGNAVNRLFLFWIKHLISSFSKDTCLQLDKLGVVERNRSAIHS
jgi:hypothetical protein